MAKPSEVTDPAADGQRSGDTTTTIWGFPHDRSQLPADRGLRAHRRYAHRRTCWQGRLDRLHVVPELRLGYHLRCPARPPPRRPVLYRARPVRFCAEAALRHCVAVHTRRRTCSSTITLRPATGRSASRLRCQACTRRDPPPQRGHAASGVVVRARSRRVLPVSSTSSRTSDDKPGNRTATRSRRHQREDHRPGPVTRTRHAESTTFSVPEPLG
jgi:hypothetical protein